ncbi:hypothetical protein [Chryseobacterium joostei]|uniref:hypothetical protein n=1 Tax=Chryseobacterium joostei TaxID=112234 RepID=UPI003D10C794
MNNILMVLFAFVFFIQGKGQLDHINSGKYHSAKEHFETKYQRQEHSRFLRSQIRIERNRVVMNVINVIEFSESLDDKYKFILENGLLNPVRINGSPVLRISVIDELPLLSTDPQTKRFKLWVFVQENGSLKQETLENLLKNSVNPDEYYFELYNENADINTSFNEFVEGAKLTYIGYGGIII